MSKRKRQPHQPNPQPGQPEADRDPGTQAANGAEDAIREVEAQALRAASERADAAEARADELAEKLQRALADFRNETQRIARQADERRKFAVEGLVGELLPVFDALHSARQGISAHQGIGARGGLGAEAGGDALDAVRQGLDLVEKELLTVLGRHGVQRIEAAGEPFDPGLHEAVFVMEHPELDPSTVAQVLRPGFTLHGRVVRPAHVAVTPAAEAPGAPDADSDLREGD